jgi:hypothetical protein
MSPSRRERPRLLSLFVRYGLGAHGSSAAAVSRVEELHALYADRLDSEYISVVIDNALPPGTPPSDHGTHWVVAGDNECSEFSAWDIGWPSRARASNSTSFSW